MADQEGGGVRHRQWFLDIRGLPDPHPLPCLLQVCLPAEWGYRGHGRSGWWDPLKAFLLCPHALTLRGASQYLRFTIQTHHTVLNEHQVRVLCCSLPLWIHFCFRRSQLHWQNFEKVWEIWCLREQMAENCLHGWAMKEFFCLCSNFGHNLCVWRYIEPYRLWFHRIVLNLIRHLDSAQDLTSQPYFFLGFF